MWGTSRLFEPGNLVGMQRAERGAAIETDVRRMSQIGLAPSPGADGKAVEPPLLRLPRPSSTSGWRSIAIVGAVSAVAVLAFAVASGVRPAVLALGITAVFALGAAVGARLPLSPRRRGTALDGARQYRHAFDHLPLATIVARASDLKLVYASPQAERLLGLPRELHGTLGDVWNARLHELDRARVLDA